MTTDSKAVIFGCATAVLSEDERRFYGEVRPAGFILFARNCEAPDQVRKLVDDLRASIDDPAAPVLIDQEGGRVARLRPPHWPARPAAARFGELYAADAARGLEAAELSARLTAMALADLGITVNCAPVLDVAVADTHKAIGDRAFSQNPIAVTRLGGAVRQGIARAGVAPVIKHLPGQGRASVDSHLELPRIEASLADLESRDFPPLRAHADADWGIVAHIVYIAIDPERAASVSPTVIAETIRAELGFEGVLLSDDIGMEALRGTPADRAARVVATGCDIALHCNGDFDEMQAVAAAMPALTERAQARLALAESNRQAGFATGFDPVVAEARLAELLG